MNAVRFCLLTLALLISTADAAFIALNGGRGSLASGGAIDPAADWAIRSSGADCAQNFSSFADTTAIRAWENVANPSTLSLTTQHALSGKAARLTTLDTDSEVSQGFLSTLNCRRMKGQSTSADVFTAVHFQFIVWADDFFDWPFRSTSNNAPKVAILDREPQCDICAGFGPNSNEGEIVIDNQSTHGFVTGYRLKTSDGSTCGAGTYCPWERGQATPNNSGNYARQNAVNRGTTVTDENSAQRRYGPMYSGMTCDSQTPSIRLSTQCGAGYPDPDAAQGGISWNRGGYTVVEICADYSHDRIKVWAAHYGDDPLLIEDSDLSQDGTAGINARTDISGWAGITLLTFRTNGIAEGGVRPTPINVDYPEFIIKTGSSSASAIPFPGNKPLPGAGCNS